MGSNTVTTTTTMQDDADIIGTFGVEYIRSVPPSRRPSISSALSDDYNFLASGYATPDPLLGKAPFSRATSRRPSLSLESQDPGIHELQDLHPTSPSHKKHSPFEPLSSLAPTTNPVPPPTHHRQRRLTPLPTTRPRPTLAEEESSTLSRKPQTLPPELPNLTSELIFITVCSSGQLLFATLQGNINVNQHAFALALALPSGEIPWLVSSFLVPLGLSVILSGSLTDLLPPKLPVVAALVWLTVWNMVGSFTLHPSRKMAFFFTRAMQGLAVGVLVSGSMSILGRVYSPGRRKTRVFSAVAAAAPMGFWLGAVQGGALERRLEWIFGSNAVVCAVCAGAAFWSIPALRPVADGAGVDAPTLRQFDWKGALCAVVGCVCLLFGLTQGSGARWSPYTYVLILVGVALMALFFWLETKVVRPLVPARLWRTPGFAPLMLAYFLGFGGFIGAWQFYAMQFFLTQQHVSAMTVALYLLPNAIFGVLATFVVSRLMHRIPGHYIFLASQFFFALGPAFFLPQTPSTNYFALSMPGIALATFGPDLSFAAASIYITSSVPRSYQGSAGALLVTIQNLSGAIMTSVADSIAVKVDSNEEGEVGLKGLQAAWWLALAAAAVGGVVTAIWVRIPKEEEKEHVA